MAGAEVGPSGLTDCDQFRARRADRRSIPIAIPGQRVEPRIHEMPGEPGLVDEAQSIDADGHVIRAEAEMRLIGDEFSSDEPNVIVDLDARAIRRPRAMPSIAPAGSAPVTRCPSFASLQAKRPVPQPMSRMVLGGAPAKAA